MPTNEEQQLNEQATEELKKAAADVKKSASLFSKMKDSSFIL